MQVANYNRMVSRPSTDGYINF